MTQCYSINVKTMFAVVLLDPTQHIFFPHCVACIIIIFSADKERGYLLSGIMCLFFSIIVLVVFKTASIHTMGRYLS